MARAPVGTIAGRPMAPRPTLTTTPSLRYWRTQRGLLQRELAEQANVDLTTVQRLERGMPARLDTMRRLADALEVKPTDLMGQPPEI